MKTQLTYEQMAAYRENGFVFHPEFLSPEEVVDLKTAVLQAVESMGRKKVAGGGRDMEEGDTHYDKVFTQRLNLWRINSTVKRTMLNPELGRLLCRLTGAKSISRRSNTGCSRRW